MSRAESQARTRAALVETARVMFLRDGYAATSMERVAEEAGFSKGAVYSNFAGKDALCLAVVETLTAEVAEAVRGALQQAVSQEAGLAAFDSWADARLGDPDWSALEAELMARSRHDPGLREALHDRNALLRSVIAEALLAGCARHGLVLQVDADVASSALLSLGFGLGIQRAVTPSLPVRTISDVVRALVRQPPERATVTPT